MKTTVTYLNKNYYVNNQKNTVICKLRFAINLDNINNNGFIAIDTLGIIDKILDKLEMEDSSYKYYECGNFCTATGEQIYSNNGIIVFDVMGRSIASDKDEFDIELGKKLALTRAQQKAFTKSSKIYNTICNYINKTIVKQIKFIADNNDMASIVCGNHVKEILRTNNLV